MPTAAKLTTALLSVDSPPPPPPLAKPQLTAVKPPATLQSETTTSEHRLRAPSPKFTLISFLAFMAILISTPDASLAPIPRPLLTLVAWTWLWACVKVVLKRAGMAWDGVVGGNGGGGADASTLSATTAGGESRLIASSLSGILGGWWAVSGVVSVVVGGTGDHTPAAVIRTLATMCTVFYLVMPASFVNTAHQTRHAVRRHLNQILFPVWTSSGVWGAPPTFADVVVTDVLTSFSRPLAEWSSLACSIILPGIAKSASGCRHPALLMLVTAIPYALRLKQCLNEFMSTGARNSLLNAAKYSTIFPVLVLGVYLRAHEEDSEHRHWRTAFIVAAAVNSTYSLYWDIRHDWALGDWRATWPGLRRKLTVGWAAFIPEGVMNIGQHSYRPLHLHGSDDGMDEGDALPLASPKPRLTASPSLYYLVVLANTVVRYQWSIPFIFKYLEYEDIAVPVLAMQVAELLRRAVWVVFRVEREVLGRSPGGLSPRATKDIARGGYELNVKE